MDHKLEAARIIDKLGILDSYPADIKLGKIITELIDNEQEPIDNKRIFGKTADEFVYYLLNTERYLHTSRSLVTVNDENGRNHMRILKMLLDNYGYPVYIFDYLNSTQCTGLIGSDLYSILGIYSHINFCRHCDFRYDFDLKDKFIPSNGELVNCYICGANDMVQIAVNNLINL